MTDLQYQAAHPDTLSSASLDGLELVYHRTSGKTHIMIEPMPDLLEILSQQPKSLDDIAAECGVADRDRPVLRERLDELLDTGLISAL